MRHLVWLQWPTTAYSQTSSWICDERRNVLLCFYITMYFKLKGNVKTFIKFISLSFTNNSLFSVSKSYVSKNKPTAKIKSFPFLSVWITPWSNQLDWKFLWSFSDKNFFLISHRRYGIDSMHVQARKVLIIICNSYYDYYYFISRKSSASEIS